MDITKIDLNHIELFALAYSVAEQVFSVEPIKANPKKQTKIRKWVNKTYIDGDDFPEEVLSFIDDSKSDSEFIEFMAECSEYINERETRKKQLFEKATTDFSEDVKKAFVHLFETTGCCDSVKTQANKIVFNLDETDSYKRTLILHTSTENRIENFDLLGFTEAQILKEENGYKLICIAENFEQETSTPISIFFDHATVEVNIYRADRTEFGITPWDTLSSVACDILSKKNLGDEYFNQKERELMPLIKEISGLSPWPRLLDEEPPGFEILKQYIRKYNLLKLIPLLDKAAAEYTNLSSKQMYLQYLINKLNETDCEALWRELYELIGATQEGYSDKILSYNKTDISNIRLRTEKNFHDLGYEGEYPTFRKKGAIKGIKLEESYNQTYFVGAEKNAEHIIHCTESVYRDELQIQFLCGTALLKKNESLTDVYSCCFNAKGKKLFKSIHLFEEDEPDIDFFNLLDQYTQIAAKRAECTKLSKKEKELLGNAPVSWQYFVFMFIFTGGLFAVLMTAAAFLILCSVDAILFGFSDIPDMISQMPWWLFFLISFVGFGGAMAIVDVKAKTK